MEAIRRSIASVPDFPKPGILFRDITPLLGQPEAFQQALKALEEHVRPWAPDRIAAIESRGFLFGLPLALALGIGFVPIRKPGKLPRETLREGYELEYGASYLEVHVDALRSGERVVVVDDLLATGGTAAAAGRLVTRLGGMVAGFAFLIELEGLRGRQRLEAFGAPVASLIRFEV
ncbi:MAG: adenine phosphoribosyltransferase, partial [Bacillota bacterium]